MPDQRSPARVLPWIALELLHERRLAGVGILVGSARMLDQRRAPLAQPLQAG